MRARRLLGAAVIWLLGTAQAAATPSAEEAVLRAVRAITQFTGQARAEPSADCAPNFLGGQSPRLLRPQLAQKTRALCSPGYAVLHSGITRTPLWSAEHLTPERIRAATHLSRENSFRADGRLPAGERAELEDYSRSGWDRGHMSPNKDMPDRESQQAAFLLSNMIPQPPTHNQQLWESIEHATRALVRRGEHAYVVTGPAYLGDVSRTGRVAIPSHVWKAVYLPSSGRAGAWWTENRGPAGDHEWEWISIDELARRTGVDAFPALTGDVRQSAAQLSKPTLRSRRHDARMD